MPKYLIAMTRVKRYTANLIIDLLNPLEARRAAAALASELEWEKRSDSGFINEVTIVKDHVPTEKGLPFKTV